MAGLPALYVFFTKIQLISPGGGLFANEASFHFNRR